MTTQKPPSQQGCAWVEDCIEICTGDSVFVEDQGVRATFLNRRHRDVRKIHYDGCYAAVSGRQADYIVGLVGTIDVIVELKGSDANLKDAALQVESTLDTWRRDAKREKTIAALIVYGRIEGPKKLPGRFPRAAAVILGLTAEFLKTHKILLRIHENGERQFAFNDFLRKTDAND
jgi:hypothetical protein